MLHIVTAIYQSLPLFFLFILPSASLQQPTLGLRWALVSAQQGSILKLPQGTGGLLKYGGTVSGTGKPSSDPALSVQTPFSTPNRSLSFLLVSVQFFFLMLFYCGKSHTI